MLGAADFDACNRARGKGADVVWIQHFEQRFREFRVIVVEAPGDACIEQGERLDHALDVRILAHFTTDQEPPGDFWITLGEVAQVTAQVAQFLLVIRK